MTRHFRTLAKLERQMEAAHQLRSETLASATRNAIAQAVRTFRRTLVRVDADEPRQA